MAEEMGAAGIHCSNDWWDRSRSMQFMNPSSAPYYSAATLDDVYMGNFDRSMNYCSSNYIKSRSCKGASLDSPARVFGSDLNIGPADLQITGSSPSSIWNHRMDGPADENNNIDTILQEDMDSSRILDWSPNSLSNGMLEDDSSMNAFKHINQELSNNLDQSGTAKCTALPFGYSPSIVQSLMDPQEIPIGGHSSMMNFQCSLFQPFLENKNQSTGFPILSNVLSSFGSFTATSSPSQFATHSLREHVACRKDLIMKLSKGDLISVVNEGDYEPAYKRPRIETPLPTFKVRKEKLGDRVTALQQIVSPFGKTDTASVLHEAVEYIKFLHKQITTVVNQHKENGFSIHSQHQVSVESKDGEEPKEDLRSRGLCLMPISSMSAYANETRADSIWTPNLLGGTFL